MPRRCIEITTNVGCRNLCEYCPQEVNIAAFKVRSRDRQMKLADFKICLEKVPLDVKVYFAGSAEPFLCPDGLDMVEFACSRGHEVYVYTTLVGLDEAGIGRLKKMPVFRYVVHLPSAVLKENFFADEAYVRVLKYLDKTLDPARVEYMALQEAAPAAKAALEKPIRETKREAMSDFGGNVTLGYIPHRSLSGKIYCNNDRLYWNVLYPNGDVSLCCEDFGLKHIIGNLLTDQYDDLHRSDEFNRVIRGMSDDTVSILCRKCEYATQVAPKLEDHVPIVPETAPVAESFFDPPVPPTLMRKVKSLIPVPVKARIKSLLGL